MLRRLLSPVFHSILFLSGQLILDFWRTFRPLKFIVSILEVPFFLLFFGFNTGALAFNLYAIFIKCPFPDCGYVAGPFEINPLKIDNASRPGITPEYVNGQKVVVTMATLSGSLSYLIMMYILITHYSFIL